jgi:lipoprotein-releasing system ATP-binding protein
MNESPAQAAADGAVFECRGVVRRFREGLATLEVLSGIDLTVRKAERVAIVGASGSGKSTLPLAAADEAVKGEIRNRFLGFVYQFHHLLPEFSAQENVAMPLLIRRMPKSDALARARELLERVGLGQRLTHKPGELSGGERQRAAVARAVITRPMLVLADEPTGNLDAGNGEQVLRLMLELNRELATSLIIVTHDHSIAERMDRMLTLEDGRLR